MQVVVQNKQKVSLIMNDDSTVQDVVMVVENETEEVQEEFIEMEPETIYEIEMEPETTDADEMDNVITESDIKIRKQAPRVSAIWNHFQLNGSVATCSHCKLDMNCGSNKSTSALFRHMRTVHPLVTSDLKSRPKKKGSLPSLVDNETNKEVEDYKVTKNGKVRKPIPRFSGIWKHFKLNGTQAKCLHCNLNMKCGSNQSTSALFRHMRAMHQSQAKEIIPRMVNRTKKGSLPDIEIKKIRKRTAGDLPIGRPSLNKLQSTEDRVLFLLAREYLSLDLVESGPFHSLLKSVNTKCTLPSKQTLRETVIPNKCFTLAREIQRKLHHVTSMCLTTDEWTSRNCQNYVSITAHWINRELFEHSSALLTCACYEHTESSEILKNIVETELEKWKISNKVSCIVSNGALNMRSAIELGRWPYIECFAHALTAVADSATNHIGDVLEKVGRIVGFFSRSSVAEKKLLEVQKDNNITVQKLLQCCPMRWKTTYKMLSRFSEMRNCIITTIESLTIPYLPILPSEEDWSVIELACLHLQPIFSIIKEMEAENYVLLSKVIPYTNILKESVDQAIQSETFQYAPESIQNLLNTLHFELNAKFGDIEERELLAEATLLDPRFKEFAFQDQIKAEVAITRIRRKLGTRAVTAVPVQNTDTNNVWGRFEQKLKQLKPKKDEPTSRGFQDLQNYLLDKYLDRKSDPLKWWLRKLKVYPKLAEFAIQRLCIQGATAPCQDIFSRSGLIRCESRSSLKPDMLCELVFLNHNL